MFFGFDDEQRELHAVVATLLEAQCPVDLVRAAWECEPGDLDRDLWQQLADVGVLDALLPAEQGGAGLDERSIVLVLEEAGRVALPLPLVDTALVASAVVGARCGAAMVVTDLGGPYVSMAADADRLLLHDRTRGQLHVVGRSEVRLSATPSVDRARRLSRVEWTPAPSTCVTDDPVEIGRAFDRGAFGTSALLVGLADRMLRMTTSYVIERHQFGVPVGSFQAVKHHLANALTELSFAKPAVERASWSLATAAPTRSRDVSMAKAMASDAAVAVGRHALQCHGAIGYTVEHDLHLFLKRANALAASWGDAAWHRERIGRELGIVQ